MATDQLDEVDMGILHLLQSDARNLTPVDMAKRLPVSEGTVRNRIERLRDRGIIEGYVPVLNYEAAGFPLKVMFECSVKITNRADLAEKCLDLPHVVGVQEIMTGHRNIRVVTVATVAGDITRTGQQLEELGVEIEDEYLLRRELVQPFDHFGDGLVKNDR